jgi:hypothetical protein
MISTLKSWTRYVAYIDILGFKEMLKNGDFDTKTREIVGALEDRRGYDREHHPYLDYLAISDTIIVTAKLEHASELLWKVSQLQNKLLSLGFCTRGGISFGELLVYGSPINNIFGQALVDAYLLEYERAIYPRVIVDDGIVKQIRTEIASKKSGREETLLLRDRDGVTFVNQFGRDVINATSKKPSPRKKVKENKITYAEKIRDGLKNADEPKAKMKWHWLQAEYEAQFQDL